MKDLATKVTRFGRDDLEEMIRSAALKGGPGSFMPSSDHVAPPEVIAAACGQSNSWARSVENVPDLTLDIAWIGQGLSNLYPQDHPVAQSQSMDCHLDAFLRNPLV